jgi:hypothetical protein
MGVICRPTTGGINRDGEGVETIKWFRSESGVGCFTGDVDGKRGGDTSASVTVRLIMYTACSKYTDCWLTLPTTWEVVPIYLISVVHALLVRTANILQSRKIVMCKCMNNRQCTHVVSVDQSFGI